MNLGALLLAFVPLMNSKFGGVIVYFHVLGKFVALLITETSVGTLPDTAIVVSVLNDAKGVTAATALTSTVSVHVHLPSLAVK